MRRLALIAVLTGLWAGAAGAAERLQVPQLAGWRIVSNVADRAGEATELIPEAETAETWTRRITIQAFRAVPMTVTAFLDKVVANTAAVCDNASAGQAGLGTVSGVEAGSRTIACGRYKGDGMGSYTLYYVIRGREALYVVSRSWRGQPFGSGITPITAAELADWAGYVNALELCDTRAPQGACR